MIAKFKKLWAEDSCLRVAALVFGTYIALYIVLDMLEAILGVHF